MIETSSGELVDFSSLAQWFDTGRPINLDLTYQGRERMVLILQTDSNLFCPMKTIEFWFKFQPNVPIDNNPGLIQIMSRQQKRRQAISRTNRGSLRMPVCVARPQRVNILTGGLSSQQGQVIHVMTLPCSYRQLLRPGVGVTKAPFVNFSMKNIFDLAKVPVIFFVSHSYLTGVTAVKLRRHQPNINVLFNSLREFWQCWKIRKITEQGKLA